MSISRSMLIKKPLARLINSARLISSFRWDHASDLDVAWGQFLMNYQLRILTND